MALLLSSLLDSSQERLRISTHNLLHLLRVLEDQERGHGADAELLCYVGHLVDVELDEVCAGEVVGEPVHNSVSLNLGLWDWEGREGVWEMGEYELDNLRSNDFAGTTPGGERVDDDDGVIIDGGLELVLAADIMNAHICG
jgi:hypothetical protein